MEQSASDALADEAEAILRKYAAERLRAEFERLANGKAACGFKRSRKGTYVNPQLARDWKWFQLGAIAKENQG